MTKMTVELDELLAAVTGQPGPASTIVQTATGVQHAFERALTRSRQDTRLDLATTHTDPTTCRIEVRNKSELEGLLRGDEAHVDGTGLVRGRTAARVGR